MVLVCGLVLSSCGRASAGEAESADRTTFPEVEASVLGERSRRMSYLPTIRMPATGSLSYDTEGAGTVTVRVWQEGERRVVDLLLDPADQVSSRIDSPPVELLEIENELINSLILVNSEVAKEWSEHRGAGGFGPVESVDLPIGTVERSFFGSPDVGFRYNIQLTPADSDQVYRTTVGVSNDRGQSDSPSIMFMYDDSAGQRVIGILATKGGVRQDLLKAPLSIVSVRDLSMPGFVTTIVVLDPAAGVQSIPFAGNGGDPQDVGDVMWLDLDPKTDLEEW
jgi:hypothetical protein